MSLIASVFFVLHCLTKDGRAVYWDDREVPTAPIFHVQSLAVPAAQHFSPERSDRFHYQCKNQNQSLVE
uniref:Putative secreted protein n=1 Tax=Anopheles darlingi TaxID=43151 RepID=A0A2M4D6F2_ANODA